MRESSQWCLVEGSENCCCCGSDGGLNCSRLFTRKCSVLDFREAWSIVNPKYIQSNQERISCFKFLEKFLKLHFMAKALIKNTFLSYFLFHLQKTVNIPLQEAIWAPSEYRQSSRQLEESLISSLPCAKSYSFGWTELLNEKAQIIWILTTPWNYFEQVSTMATALESCVCRKQRKFAISIFKYHLLPYWLRSNVFIRSHFNPLLLCSSWYFSPFLFPN